MKKPYTKGQVLVCPVCKAEITIIAGSCGSFVPVCCNVEMQPLEKKLTFYRCEICGAEIAVLVGKGGNFIPVCCNEVMKEERPAA